MPNTYSCYLQENQFVRVSLSMQKRKCIPLYLISLTRNMFIYRGSITIFISKFSKITFSCSCFSIIWFLRHIKESCFIIYAYHPSFEIFGHLVIFYVYLYSYLWCCVCGHAHTLSRGTNICMSFICAILWILDCRYILPRGFIFAPVRNS